MIVVEDERNRVGELGNDLVDKTGDEVFIESVRITHALVADEAKRLERGEDIVPEALRVVIARIEREPGNPFLVLDGMSGPLAEQ